MKNKLIKLICSLVLFISLLFPSSRVLAESWSYYGYGIPLSNILGHVPEKGTYYINGPSRTLVIAGNDRENKTPPVFWLHQIYNGTNYYHGYCLHSGLPVRDNAQLTPYTTLNNLVSLYNNQPLSQSQVTLLENILASGYQNGVGPVEGTIFRSTGSGRECIDKTVCRKIFATQILIWEIMDYARTDYNVVPTVNPDSSPYNNIVNVEGNEELLIAYKQILKDAKDLTSEGEIPTALTKSAITLRWNDNTSRYESSLFSIGKYNFNKVEGATSNYKITVSNKDSNNKIKVYSNKFINNSPKLTFSLTKGSLNKSSLGFMWFKFPSSGYQDVLVGDYKKTFSRSVGIKTESGKLTLSKVDSSTNKLLKGATFEIRKCGANRTDCTKDIQKIDLTTNASKDITLKKSGWYLLVETKTPENYEKLPDTYLKINISDGKANVVSHTSKDSVKKEGNSDNKIVLINEAKEISISKIDGRTSKAIKGATFQIRNLDGNALKFEIVNGTYRYKKGASIANIVNSDLSEYKIALLPAGEYIVKEIAVPYPYVLPKDKENKETKIKIDSNYNLYVYNSSTKKYIKTVDATVIIKNYDTKVKIKKTGENKKALSQVEFELYDSSKTNQISLISSQSSLYDYNPETSEPMKLVTNSDGIIIIRYLPEGTYYLKEVKTNDGYAIDPSNEWTKIVISSTEEDHEYIYKTISNAKGEFCFYKIDEDGNYLNDGVFKLQTYNETTSKFEDTPLIFNEENKMYSIDTTGKGNVYTFSPISNGETCFQDVNAKGKYRIVEIEAPEGFVLPKISEASVEILINENGYAIGDAVIINKKIVTGEGAEAQAELIVNISTGQDRIHYIIIICSLFVTILALLILNKKINKK